MKKSLQQMFVESRGKPVSLGDLCVVQMDRIPITTGAVKIRFFGHNCTGTHGVAIKSSKGGVELSNGERAKIVYTWDEPGLPRSVSYSVDCPDGELRVWNVFRTKHSTGEITEDAWTGNAGMTIEYPKDRTRLYRCSAGPGRFEPDEFRFELSW